MFTNTRSGAKSAELRAHKMESEEEAKSRLESDGWDLNGAQFDTAKKLFTMEELTLADPDDEKKGDE
jgi:hypothetical protein